MKTKETTIQKLIRVMNEDQVGFTEWFIDNNKFFLEMEEDQIIFAWEDGFREGCEEKLRDYSAQDYYKRTYGTPQ